MILPPVLTMQKDYKPKTPQRKWLDDKVQKEIIEQGIAAKEADIEKLKAILPKKPKKEKKAKAEEVVVKEEEKKDE